MFESLHEISQNQADLIKSFAIFYLLLVGNYVDDSLFTCFQVNYFKSHIWLQLLLAFLLFYFLVSLVSDTGKLEFTPPIEKFIYSIIYFFGFLIVMRLDLRLTATVLLLIFIIYFLELNKDFYLDMGTKIDNSSDQDIYNNNQYWITFDRPFKIRLFHVKETDFKIINKIETILYYIIIFLLVIGFISYGGEIKDNVSRSKNLTWLDVVIDTKVCSLKEKKSFLHYFKTGLGLKL